MIDYLSMIAGRDPNSYLEVRYFPSGRPAQRWFKATELQAAANLISEQASRCDVFVGAAPRTAKGGGKKAIRHSYNLWVDIDSPDWEQRITRADVAPSYIVASGSGGVHAYWTLTRPMPVNMVEWSNRRLAHRVGGDMACTDASRILRPPGTWNHKTNPPRPVTRIAGHGRMVSALIVADMDDPRSKPKPVPRTTERTATGDRLRGISALEYVPRLTGREPNGRGLIQCPFHGGGQERTPSLKAYSDPSKGWWCFGCRKGGTAIDMAAELWGMGTRGEDFKALKDRLEGALL